MKKAFTLAEVLITLSIIGVVAVLTVPSAVTNYQKKVIPVKLEKFYVEMSGAIRLSQMYNGNSKYWTYPTEENAEEYEVFFNKYFAKYLKYTKTEINENDKLDIYLVSGNIIRGFWAHPYTHSVHMSLAVDDKTVKYGKNAFTFLYQPSYPARGEYYAKEHFGPYIWPYDETTMTREIALEDCKTRGIFCPALIQMDDWKISDDYPW